MLFSEVYGNYYSTIASILDKAIDKQVSPEEIRRIVDEKAFAESVLTIPDKLSYKGEWPLLDEFGNAIIMRETYMPLTLLEKRWLKSLLLDPRIELFSPSKKGLEDVEPLFKPDDIIFFDQFNDGDPFQDETYIRIFRKLLLAIREKSTIKVLYQLKNDSKKWINCNPVRLEYSLRDDKFRLISVSKSKINTMNVSKIAGCEEIGTFTENEIKEELYNKRTVEIWLKDERDALDRVMIQFSIYKKITEKIKDNEYRIILTYEENDEVDILIRILSFGSNLRVIGPDSFVNHIKKRIEMQRSCRH